MKTTIAYFANSEGCMLSPKIFSHRREPLMLTPIPGIITRISVKALAANKKQRHFGTPENPIRHT